MYPLYNDFLSAMSAYLDDGFEERLLDEANQNKKVLRLHPSISPIKLVILTEDPSNEEQFDLANRFSKEVKTAGKSSYFLLIFISFHHELV